MQRLADIDLASNPEVAKLAKQLRRAVDSIVGPAADFQEHEAAALAVSNEATRQDLETRLQEIAGSHGPRLSINDVLYKQHVDGHVAYHSLCGDLHVRRASYRRTGEHNGPTCVPLELEAGVVQRCTPALAEGIALGYGKHDMRCHHEDLVAAHRVPPSRTTLESAAKRIAKEAHEVSPRIEPYIRRTEQLPEGAFAISVGLDRTAVPMEEQRGDAPPKGRRRQRHTPYVRCPPPPIDVVWRMAYVGTFSVVNSLGEALVTRRYTATADEGTERIVSQLMADVRSALREDERLNVGIMQDGAPELWSVLRAALAAEPTVDQWLEGIDKYHLLERLGNALELMEPEARSRKWWFTHWSHDLDNHDAAIDVIEHHLLERYGALRGRTASKLWEHLVYIRNNKDRMRYVSLARAGLPVGSGVTEGAAKSVIGLRAKGCGRRWSEDGLRGVLTLRASYCSERFSGLWRHLSRRYTARVEEAA